MYAYEFRQTASKTSDAVSVCLSVCVCVCLYLCIFMSVCVCLCSVPSKPDDLIYLSSTESTITLSWKQTGVADNYTVQYNDTNTSPSFNVTSVSNDSVTIVTMTVSDLPTPGDYYCITVTALRAHLRSDTATLCNYTGEQLSVGMHVSVYHHIISLSLWSVS